MNNRLESWKDKTKRLKIGVIGDFCLDRNNIYNNTGLKSLEFDGIPINSVVNPETEFAPGGAGNVVVNFKKLGVNVVPFGIRGMDPTSLQLMHLFEQQGIQTFGLIPDMRRLTPKYEKFYLEQSGKRKQTFRLDTYNEREPSLGVQNLLLEKLEEELKYLSGFYIADQIPTKNNPCITLEMRKGLERILGKAGIPVMVDSRERTREWTGGFILKPNEDEIGIEDYREINNFLIEHKLPFMYLTQHDKGVTLFQKNDISIYIPTIPVKNGDPTGCGDAWGTAALTSLCLGTDAIDAAKFGNAAAYHTIQQIGGCGMPNLEELFKNYKFLYEA